MNNISDLADIRRAFRSGLSRSTLPMIRCVRCIQYFFSKYSIDEDIVYNPGFPDVILPNGLTLFQFVIDKRNEMVLHYLRPFWNISQIIKDANSQSMLYSVFITASLEFIQSLLMIIPVTLELNDEGDTPLHWVMWRVSLIETKDIIQYMINRGARPEKENKRGISPLKLAIQKAKTSWVGVMTPYVPIKYLNKSTILSLATQSLNSDMVRLILPLQSKTSQVLEVKQRMSSALTILNRPMLTRDDYRKKIRMKYVLALLKGHRRLRNGHINTLNPQKRSYSCQRKLNKKNQKK